MSHFVRKSKETNGELFFVRGYIKGKILITIKRVKKGKCLKRSEDNNK